MQSTAIYKAILCPPKFAMPKPREGLYIGNGLDADTSRPGVRLRFPSLRGVDARRLLKDVTPEDAGLDPAPPLRLCADA